MVRPRTYDVYLITCPYGVYVGSTELQLNTRWSVHKNKLKRGIHPCKGLQRAYDEGYTFDKPVVLTRLRSQYKASCLMAERYYQLLFSKNGELLNTRIEKQPTGAVCKYGEKFANQIKDLY